MIIGDVPRPTPTALLARSFPHPAACEVRALACGEIERWVSGCLYKTEKEELMRLKQVIHGKCEHTLD
jgi:hypothetical protein